MEEKQEGKGEGEKKKEWEKRRRKICYQHYFVGKKMVLKNSGKDNFTMKDTLKVICLILFNFFYFIVIC